MYKIILLLSLFSLSFAQVSNEDLLKLITANKADTDQKIAVMQTNQSNIIKQMELDRRYADKRFEAQQQATKTLRQDMNSRFDNLINIFIAVMSGFAIAVAWIINRNDKKLEQSMQRLETAFKLQDEKVNYKLADQAKITDEKVDYKLQEHTKNTEVKLASIQTQNTNPTNQTITQQLEAITAVFKALAQNDQNIAKQLRVNGLL